MVESLRLTPPSSRGLGRGPLKAKTGVRVPLGALTIKLITQLGGLFDSVARLTIYFGDALRLSQMSSSNKESFPSLGLVISLKIKSGLMRINLHIHTALLIRQHHPSLFQGAHHGPDHPILDCKSILIGCHPPGCPIDHLVFGQFHQPGNHLAVGLYTLHRTDRPL